MDTRPAPSVERAFALALLSIALVGAAYVFLKEGWRHAFDEPSAAAEVAQAGDSLPVVPVPTPEPAPTPDPEPVPKQHSAQLTFPLAGFEHALRDNFAEARGSRRHNALDIMAPRGTPVRAVDEGPIAKLYRGPLAGIALYQFDAGKTRVYFYAHLDRYAAGVKEGNWLKRGDVIGYVGSTGNAPETAPHLHFEMRELEPGGRWWKGKAVNPYDLLRGQTTFIKQR